MYFKISKKNFLENLNIVSSAVSVTSPLPVLHNIKISAKDDYIRITASDSDISIQTTLKMADDENLQIIEEGDILLDKKYVTEIVRKMDSDIIEVEVVDGSLTKIRGTAVNFDLNGSAGNTYPHIDFSKPEESFFINATTLKNVIIQTCFATSDKETRPVLTGLNFNCSSNELVCVATDSYRLARKKVILNEDHNFNITIPAKSLNEIAKILNNDEEIEVSINEKKALFTIGDVLFQTRLIEGSYPETSKLFPSEFSYELVVDARDLLNAIDRPTFIKNDGVSIIRMEMNQNEITLTSKSNEAVYKENIVPISYKGEPLNIAFKSNYVFDAIRALNSLNIKISFTGEMKPFVLKAADSDDNLQLVLPIRTYM